MPVRTDLSVQVSPPYSERRTNDINGPQIAALELYPPPSSSRQTRMVDVAQVAGIYVVHASEGRKHSCRSMEGDDNTLKDYQEREVTL